MHLGAVLITLFSATFSVAENTVETNDVPNTCLAACQFTIDLSARCDQETDGDSGYRTCVCGAADSQIRLTECATCVKDNGMRDPDDNDVADLMDDCGWDFNSASASYTSGASTISATSVTSTSPTVTTAVITSSSGSVVVTTAQTITQTASSTSSVSTGAAPLATAGVGSLVMGGLIMGIPAFF
ncbi:hypothetical protein F4819DRAFT_473961 [Hypoxylon fuscum]|nr:hypothetical protein F4819DRAFT_473961 [Hypoxylon fuscum]